MIKNLKTDLHNQYKKMEEMYTTSEEKERITENIMVLQDKLHNNEAERIERARKSVEIKYLTEGETSSKYWFNLNKDSKPPNIIYGLQNEKGEITTETRQMVEIASRYHTGLQAKPEMNEKRRTAIDKMKKN